MRLRSTAAFLLGGVSILALAVSAPEASAADLLPSPLVRKGPLVPLFNPWTWWVEGGAQSVSGSDSYITGLTPPFVPGKTNWGWNIAAGVDYQFAPSWHVSGDFRCGQNRESASNSSQLFAGQLCFFGFTCTSPSVVGTNAATHSEHNWAADFMVGRDVGLGATSQVKVGLQIAEIRTQTSGTLAAAFTTNGTAVNARQAYSQDQRFLGAGPRVAVEGNIRLGGMWSLEYMGGLAGLYSLRSLSQASVPPVHA